MAVSQEKIAQFQADFADKYGENLDDMLAVMPRPMNATAFINRVSDLVNLEINLRMPVCDESLFSDVQNEVVWQAKLEQAYYMLSTEDYTIISGIDFANNQTIVQSEIDKRVFSPLARKILTSAGLQYTGLNRSLYAVDRWRKL